MEVGVGNFLMPDESWLEACLSRCLGYKFRLVAVLAWSLMPFGEQVHHPKAHSSTLGCPTGFLYPGSCWGSPLAHQHLYKMLLCFRQPATQFWACNVKERNKHNIQTLRKYKTWVSLCRSRQPSWVSNKYFTVFFPTKQNITNVTK